MRVYSLVVRNIKDFDECNKLSEEIERLDLRRYVFDECAYYKKEHEVIFTRCEPEEWQYYEKQMEDLSRKFPDFTFELSCSENMNHWREYYKNGETEFCAGDIVYERPRQIPWDELLVF